MKLLLSWGAKIDASADHKYTTFLSHPFVIYISFSFLFLFLIFFSFLLFCFVFFFRSSFVAVDHGPQTGQSGWFLPSDAEYIMSSAIKTNSTLPLSFSFYSFWSSPIPHYRSIFFFIFSSPTILLLTMHTDVKMLKFLLDNGCQPSAENVRKAVSYGSITSSLFLFLFVSFRLLFCVVVYLFQNYKFDNECRKGCCETIKGQGMPYKWKKYC